MSYAAAHACVVAANLREVTKICLSILICCMPQEEAGESEQKPASSSDEIRLKSRAADIYSMGFQIGLKPHEVRSMTVWEWGRCVEGWNSAHGAGDEVKAPAKSELDALVAKYA